MAIINPWIFYLIDVLSTLKKTSVIIAFIALFVSVVAGDLAMVLGDACYDDDSAHLIEQLIKLVKKLLIATCICTGIYTFTPSEGTMYKMLVAQNVTYENVDKATKTIKDGVDYIFKKLGKEDQKDE